MELKIICQCGQKYKFDVEPANGRMPFPVNCPVCNTDGTGTANIMLAHQLAVPPRSGQAPTAPPPPVNSYQAPPPPPPMAGLKIDKAATPAMAQMAAIAPPPLAASRPVPGAAARSAPAKPLIKEPGEYSLVRGILGAVIGSGVGCGLMYGFYLWAQFRFPLTGCAVGAAAGYMARLMARGTDSSLGAITAAIAVASLAGTFVAMYGEFPIISVISLLVSASFAYRISSG